MLGPVSGKISHPSANDGGAQWPSLAVSKVTKVPYASPLIAATRRECLEPVRLLIKAGAELDWQDNEGKTALFHAVRMRHVEVLAALIKGKAAVDIPDRALFTPLNARLLLDGAEVGATTSGGHLCAAQPVGCGAAGAPRRLTAQQR